MKKIFLIGFILLLVTGCGNSVKDAKSVNDFYNIATEKELIVSDNMASYKADYIKEAMIASKDDLEIEMITYDTEDNASKVQDEHIKSFMNRKSPSAIIKKSKGNNYYKYTMVTNGFYLVSSRIDNTLIFTKTDVKNKDIVDGILDSMGY